MFYAHQRPMDFSKMIQGQSFNFLVIICHTIISQQLSVAQDKQHHMVSMGKHNQSLKMTIVILY